MYQVVAHYKFKRPFSDDMRARVEAAFVNPLTKAAGFRSYDAFFASADRTEIVSVHTWQSAADAEHGLQGLMGPLHELLGSELAGPPQRWAGEVEVHRPG